MNGMASARIMRIGIVNAEYASNINPNVRINLIHLTSLKNEKCRLLRTHAIIHTYWNRACVLLFLFAKRLPYLTHVNVNKSVTTT